MKNNKELNWQGYMETYNDKQRENVKIGHKILNMPLTDLESCYNIEKQLKTGSTIMNKYEILISVIKANITHFESQKSYWLQELLDNKSNSHICKMLQHYEDVLNILKRNKYEIESQKQLWSR